MGRSILVAEDSPSYALLYKQMFEARGHSVMVTVDGEDCLSAYRSKIASKDASGRFDMVILDHSMPKKTGFEVAKEILAMNREQRIIFITSFGEEIAQNLAELNGGDNVDVLEKPFNSVDLIYKVEYEIEDQGKTHIISR